MSRIQDILNKAERDGSVHRTRALSDEGVMAPPGGRVPVRRRRRRTSRAGAAAPSTPAATAPALDPDRAARSALDPPPSPPSRPSRSRPNSTARCARASRGGERPRVRAILVTSPNKGDGKSLPPRTSR